MIEVTWPGRSAHVRQVRAFIKHTRRHCACAVRTSCFNNSPRLFPFLPVDQRAAHRRVRDSSCQRCVYLIERKQQLNVPLACRMQHQYYELMVTASGCLRYQKFNTLRSPVCGVVCSRCFLSDMKRIRQGVFSLS